MEMPKIPPAEDKTSRSLGPYADLADLFMYPDENLGPKSEKLQAFLDKHYPEAGGELAAFTDYALKTEVHELQEIFLRSFDVQAITTLDIGYVLFGDDYKRGAVLVHMNREHEQVGNPCYNELADHLPNVLRLIPLIEDDSFRNELVDRLLAPALRKIIREFDPSKIKAKGKIYKKHHRTLIDESENFHTIYRLPMLALYALIADDFKLTEEIPPGPSSDFLKKIGDEITLETETESPNISPSCNP